MKKIYKIYYSFLIILGLIFSIALYQSYNEKEELKKTILQSYAYIIDTAIHEFIKVKNQHEIITKDMVKEFMENLQLNYKDFEVKFLFKENKDKLKEELKILEYLKKDGFYKTFGIFDRNYYIAIKDKKIKKLYKNIFIENSEDIIGVIVFLEDEDKMDNIGGNLEENFDGKKGLFLSVWSILALIGYFLIRMLKKYFKIIEEKNQLEIETEVAKKNEQLKSEFLANMSHEIRTPLNAMFGFISLLEEKNIDEESKKYLKIIKRSGETLLNIINDILDFSKIESGKMSVEKVSFNLKKEIELVYEVFKNRASEKNIELSIKEINIDVNIISDPIRIKQILSNILNNAIKFTPEGKKIELFVSYNNEKEELYVKVKDEGIGIPKDKLVSIFQPFSQVDSSTTRKYGGTGLGLTISYNLVKLLGGELKVESEEGKGSKFYFKIKAKHSKELENKENKKISNEKFNYHILLVEDNKANQMFMSVILQQLGLTFDIANDGLEAVKIYKENYNKYDLILMDENMPNMTGSEATKEIRKFEKEKNLKSKCIVAITANALSGDKERFLKVGFNYYLSKPLDINKLKEILRNIK